MGLFNLDNNNKIILDPDALALPPIKVLWDKDKSKDKKKAIDLISYIYFVADNQSPYMDYPQEIRREKLAEDLFQDPSWRPTPEVVRAIDYYVETTKTTSMRLLHSAREACHKLADYFEDIDFKDIDDDGKPIYTAKDVASNLTAVGKIVSSLDQLEEKVNKEIKAENKIRGGGSIGEYER